MPSAKVILFLLLGLIAGTFAIVWACRLRNETSTGRPTSWQLLVGFITDFLDTLGIGSFAVTTTLYRLRKTIDDRLIPGTLNVGHALPTIVQAFIYIAIIEVDMQTLVLTILAAVLGAWLGAGVVANWPRRAIQRGMGLALLIGAGILAVRTASFVPSGGQAFALHGSRLLVALIGNFIFGALMMIGVGAYAPIMIMVGLLGMDPKAAFPIMMGSCAFLMPSAGIRIIRSGAYDARAALGLTIGGIPAVIIAAFFFDGLPVKVVAWLVVCVVIYTAVSMLMASFRQETSAAEASDVIQSKS